MRFNGLTAVDGINLEIERGKLFGFLGPNGAGKSTTIKMLSTILRPSSGTANILGYDLLKDKMKIRELIGLCPQEVVMYPRLSARENIHLIAQMHNLHPKDYKERTDDLLRQMKLLDRSNEKVKKFSGGMRRRINILMAVIHQPEVLFLDEPSAGLDPQSRRVVWDFIKDFQKQRKTIILTTHNMEEADDLSDIVNIIDHGKIIAKGDPQELKGKIGTGDIIEFKLEPGALPKRERIIQTLSNHRSIKEAKLLGKERISFTALDSLRNFSEFYSFIQSEYQVEMQDVVIRQNTLEDVFIQLTGRELRDE